MRVYFYVGLTDRYLQISFIITGNTPILSMSSFELLPFHLLMWTYSNLPTLAQWRWTVIAVQIWFYKLNWSITHADSFCYELCAVCKPMNWWLTPKNVCSTFHLSFTQAISCWTVKYWNKYNLEIWTELCSSETKTQVSTNSNRIWTKNQFRTPLIDG